MDVLTREQRHRNMSHIRGKDTTPEILVRRFLFSKGMRFRKNDKRLPGHPDIVLPKYRTVIFVNGCFWHGHDGCRYATTPHTNSEFWIGKIESNKTRDEREYKELSESGWHVVVVWECELKKSVCQETLIRLYYEVAAFQKDSVATGR